jgi:hypothetical protein
MSLSLISDPDLNSLLIRTQAPWLDRLDGQALQGRKLWFFKYFCQKIRRKNWRIWLQTKLNYAKFVHNIGFWEKRQFFAENCRKSQKILIITSTPDRRWRGDLFCFSFMFSSILRLATAAALKMGSFYVCNHKGYDLQPKNPGAWCSGHRLRHRSTRSQVRI